MVLVCKIECILFVVLWLLLWVWSSVVVVVVMVMVVVQASRLLAHFLMQAGRLHHNFYPILFALLNFQSCGRLHNRAATGFCSM